ncbi:hypothetical protein HRG_001186 [Hirsutella rhossiliensis]|uniref:Uncharacterized protein n=1 Tax=Hirsutella rhossiliensis TaxID=111463 RepID=A0A9P8N884_9HYPO|nr:uncharacterized protein HRG_01186 [Hirsutella rhossiliensis]KAH0968544.1 hypothetical protein HRG_01186 [Hirsutella rhossiliensis]
MVVERRQDNETAEAVADMTEGVHGGEPNMITYELETVEIHEYVEDKPDAPVFNTLKDPDDTTMVISCSDGNIYAVLANSAKMMHYYSAIISAAGVSRLRVADSHKTPKSSVPVLLTLYESPENQQEQFYVAVDSQEEAFYPLVCDYKDDRIGSKVFLAKDPVQGVETLQSPDVEHSVTGGKVAECFPLVLGKAKRDDKGYLIPDESEQVLLETDARE